MTSKISVCLEVGPQATGAFVPECPGCWVFGRTKERAVKKVRIVILEWFKWLSAHGESVPEVKNKVEIEIAEMLYVDYNPVEAGKPEPLFWSEVTPVKEDDIKRTILLIGHSRKDLMSLVSTITEECMDWKPCDEPRTIRNCLKHIAYVEPWYVSRLNIEVPRDYPEDVFELLNYTRDIVINCLQNFPERKMRGIFRPNKDESPICDLWTARKVLRRLVDHERLHSKYIEKVLKMHHRIERV
jgi:predicted RNase H-like HicB family nuclease